MKTKLAKWAGLIDSIIGIVGVAIILSGSLFIQYFYHEHPCTLCLLQRAAFVNVGLSLLLNMRYGNCVSHWAMAILSACAGIAVSLRHICLNINNPDGFGSPILGLHMYTWGLIGFASYILGSAFMLLIKPKINTVK